MIYLVSCQDRPAFACTTHALLPCCSALLCLACPFLYILVMLACHTHPVNNCAELWRLGGNGSSVPAAGVAAAKLRLRCIAIGTQLLFCYPRLQGRNFTLHSVSRQEIVCVCVKMKIAINVQQAQVAQRRRHRGPVGCRAAGPGRSQPAASQQP